MENIMNIETVALDDENSALVIIDQTQLPYNVEILKLTTQESIWDAIYLLQVRGAPAIGVAAAIGIYLAAKDIAKKENVTAVRITVAVTGSVSHSFISKSKYALKLLLKKIYFPQEEHSTQQSPLYIECHSLELE